MLPSPFRNRSLSPLPFFQAAKYYFEHILHSWFLRSGFLNAFQRNQLTEDRMKATKDRPEVVLNAARRRALLGTAFALGAFAINPTAAWAGSGEEISHTAESIHHEVSFKANRKRVY